MPTTNWYGTRNSITIASGGTLNISAGTLTNNGGDEYTGATLAVTTSATVGKTLGVTGNFSVGAGNFAVTALSGNTLAKGTLNSVGAFSVGGTKFTASAAGVVVAKGTTNIVGAMTVGVVASGKAIIIDPSGGKVAPGANNVQIYFDGTDIYASNNAGKTK